MRRCQRASRAGSGVECGEVECEFAVDQEQLLR